MKFIKIIISIAIIAMCNSNLDVYANGNVTPSTTSEVPVVVNIQGSTVSDSNDSTENKKPDNNSTNNNGDINNSSVTPSNPKTGDNGIIMLLLLLAVNIYVLLRTNRNVNLKN